MGRRLEDLLSARAFNVIGMRLIYLHRIPEPTLEDFLARMEGFCDCLRPKAEMMEMRGCGEMVYSEIIALAKANGLSFHEEVEGGIDPKMARSMRRARIRTKDDLRRFLDKGSDKISEKEAERIRLFARESGLLSSE